MKKSRPTIVFVIVCIGALIAAYGIALGIRKIRFTGAEGQAKVVTKEAQAKVVAKSKKPAEEPAKDKVAAKPGTTPETPGESQDRPSPEEEPRLSGERRQGMREQFANVSEEERPEAMSKRFAGTQREGRPQLSEEDRVKLNEELRQLMVRAEAGEMTEGERRRAKAEIVGKYGLPLPDGYLDGYK